MRIRHYNSNDAGFLAEIFHEAVQGIGSLDYSEKQIAAWSPKAVTSEQFDNRVSDGRTVLVAVDSDENPVGFIELEANGHIDFFYCKPKNSGVGVGLALYKELEALAVDQGITALTVEASEAAKRFFSRVGFKTEKRRDFSHRDVQIHNYLMAKRLTR
jgi:putative acetyltransferase